MAALRGGISFRYLKQFILVVIWKRRGHECSRIWKLSADFTLIQCIKIVSIFLGRDMSPGTTFLGSKLVSLNQALVPCEISEVNFRCAEKKILSVCQKRFNKTFECQEEQRSRNSSQYITRSRLLLKFHSPLSYTRQSYS